MWNRINASFSLLTKMKSIVIILLVFTATLSQAQTFLYSSNRINNATDATIIGQVKDNIIVWCKASKNNQKSVILVYDKSLELVRKENTDILGSDIDPSARFFRAGDSFYVAYQYRKGRRWEYRMAGYDSKGNLCSHYTIDSLTDDPDDILYYNWSQSADRKVLCCIKTILSHKYNALKFEFTFLDHENLYHDSLFLSFDRAHEKVIDFLINSHKDIAILKTSDTDTGVVLSVVKKEFSADHFLIANKKLASGRLRNGTIQFFYQQNQYKISGVWENASNKAAIGNRDYKTGFYTWEIHDDFLDAPGSDIILHSDSSAIFQVNHFAANHPGSITGDFFCIQTDSLPITPPGTKKTGTFHWQGVSGGTSIGSLGGGGGGGFYAYVPDRDDRDIQDSSHYKANLSIANFSDNRMVWQTALNKDNDGDLLTDPSNNKVVVDKNGVHVIRSSFTKKMKSVIQHVLITPSGKYEKINTALWNSKYNYLIPYALETNDGALIIPCLSGTRFLFARMNLDFF